MVFDAAANTLLEEIPIPSAIPVSGGVAVTPDGRKVYVINPRQSSVAVVDAAARAITTPSRSAMTRWRSATLSKPPPNLPASRAAAIATASASPRSPGNSAACRGGAELSKRLGTTG
jgi:hypothetical protein